MQALNTTFVDLGAFHIDFWFGRVRLHHLCGLTSTVWQKSWSWAYRMGWLRSRVLQSKRRRVHHRHIRLWFVWMKLLSLLLYFMGLDSRISIHRCQLSYIVGVLTVGVSILGLSRHSHDATWLHRCQLSSIALVSHILVHLFNLIISFVHVLEIPLHAWDSWLSA